MKQYPIQTIVTHHGVHDDELWGLWKAKRFGARKFPGIETAKLDLMDAGLHLKGGQDGAYWLEKGYLFLGLGGGPFDEHQMKATTRERHCTATLMATFLNLNGNPAIQEILRAAVRADRKGQKLPFELASLVKSWHGAGYNTTKVVSLFMRAADAIYRRLLIGQDLPANEPSFNSVVRDWIIKKFNTRGFRLPKLDTAQDAAEFFKKSGDEGLMRILDFTNRKDMGAKQVFDLEGVYEAIGAMQPGTEFARQFVDESLSAKYAEQERFMLAYDLARVHMASIERLGGTVLPWKVAIIRSDSDQANRACRVHEPNLQVLIQMMSNGQVRVFGQRAVNLEPVVARLRDAERKKAGKQSFPFYQLTAEGTMPEVPEWHWFKEGNSILNGSLTAPGVRRTRLSEREVVLCVVQGLNWYHCQQLKGRDYTETLANHLDWQLRSQDNSTTPRLASRTL
jgi:hypothetical protein